MDNADTYVIADTTEVWVVNILPADNIGTGAIWAAQRVPDNHFCVVSNTFNIRDIDLNDANNFIYSANMQTRALQENLWDGVSVFDFAKIFGNGE